MYKEIYDNDERIEAVLDAGFDPETGEIVEGYDAEKLIEEIQEDNKERIIGVALYAKNHAAVLDALKNAKRDIDKRIKQEAAKVDFSKNFLLMRGEKVTDDARASITFRKSTKTIIDDVSAIPAEFIKPHEISESDVNKTEIKKAIQAGENVSGAHIEEGQSCIIK